MAIASLNISCDKIPTQSSCSTHSFKGSNTCRFLKLNVARDGSFSNTAAKRGKSKNKPKSPYLTGDRVQLLSRVTEKRLVHKKTTDFVSSFPLAVNIYKANSDEFKSLKKAPKKVKKSVLTLPNDPAPVPQVCTVSDMNDSEFCDQTDVNRKHKIMKKRFPIHNKRKARVREKDFEFYDRDAQYCSQLNINLDCSSTDMMKHFNGDGKRICNKKKNTPACNKPQPAKNNLNDVWTVLRNINRFQFRPSPPMSEESIIPIRNKVKKRRANRKDTRVIETCRTEEFAYISSYELDDKTPRNFSQSSSFDRITVIDKQNEFSKICKQFEKRLLKTHDFLKDTKSTKNRPRKSIMKRIRSPKNSMRALGNVGTKENKQLTPLKNKKIMNVKTTADQQSEPTNNNGGIRDSLVDVENSQIADNFDMLSHKTLNDSVYAIRGSFIYSDNSGSSKAELPDKNNNEQMHTKEKAHMDTVTSQESSSRLKRLAKVVLNKEQESIVNPTVTKRFDPQRKPRLVTTMPSSCLLTKLTQTDIKRRLAHIKFPLVILGKDQVSSSIQVLNYDPPQFNGLDDHIWPFMIEWSDKHISYNRDDTTKDPKHNSSNSNRKYNSYLLDPDSSKTRKNNTENKLSLFLDKKQILNDTTTTKKKTETRRPHPYFEINNKLLQSTKQKSIFQLKEKMLNFLYKKSPSRNIVTEINENDECYVKSSTTFIADNKVDAITESYVKEPVTFIAGSKDDAITDIQEISVVVLNGEPKKKAAPNRTPAIGTHKRKQNYTYPWAKAKWASDFIENVIKKIRSGVYYTQEHKDLVCTQESQSGLKEASVQAGSICDTSDSTQTYDTDADLEHEAFLTNQNNFTCLPGFNYTLPMLEIKTLNMNQITVKHCVTNVMVHFDVTVPANSNIRTTDVINKSVPLIPIEVTESHTKIYKCTTTILNSMLPAELCSILPRMMSIINSTVNSDLPPALCPVKTDSCLSTISELTRYETADPIRFIAEFHMSPEIKLVLEGRFSTKNSRFETPKPRKIHFRVNYNYDLVAELLPNATLEDLSHYKVTPVIYEIYDTIDMCSQISLGKSKKRFSGHVTDIQNPTCTTVEVYNDRNKRLCSTFKPYDLVGMIESILSNHNFKINLNLTSYFNFLKHQYDGKNIEINMSIQNDKGIGRNITLTISNLKVDSLYRACTKNNNRKIHINTSDTPMKCIEHINTSLANRSKAHTHLKQVTGNKNKRKGFYKLYRKCKSTTNIPTGEKCINTPLNKVTNIEDFFQILGSKKNLCSIFDGYAAKKILSSIIEMKNWVTEINPKQALLILLLTNKKDTPNLVRFRPILLQGIAVNRITRATELDMEIEVIERENLNKFSQYEGISYLPESVTNYDNLLEELYWIAKTTASDYQRPFDESSERLLKSLLEKRKKLNPSYLRVMARYVGLGLLKTPTKN